MNRLKSSFYIVMTLVISIAAIVLSIYTSNDARNHFVIALTPEHRSLFDQTHILSEGIKRPVKVIELENEYELKKRIYSGEVDAYVVGSFFYIEQYSQLGGSWAVFGVPSDYYLVTLMNHESTQNRVAAFDSFMPSILIGDGSLSNVLIYDSEKRLIALSEDYVSHIIIHASSFDPTKHQIVEKMSNRGYTEDLLILTAEWIEYDTEHNHDLIRTLSQVMTKPLDKPAESEVLSAMTYLFRNEYIPTRYYYKDLVYSIN
ncbi:MAG TPA: hypothetical protein DCS67_04850 [Clostridiales bacterium UBA8960]|nr:hypothetical protein [Clostridiales bacterium UBA8960]